METLTCLTVLAAASITDLFGRIIPNTLTVSTCIGGLVYHLLRLPAMEGVLFAAAGSLAGGLLLLVPYRLSWTGAGDVKLLAALGAWLGPVAIARVFVFSTLVGGIMTAVHLVRYRRARLRGRRRETAPANDGILKSTIPGMPYSLAMAGGYALFLVRGGIA